MDTRITIIIVVTHAVIILSVPFRYYQAQIKMVAPSIALLVTTLVVPMKSLFPVIEYQSYQNVIELEMRNIVIRATYIHFPVAIV